MRLAPLALATALLLAAGVSQASAAETPALEFVAPDEVAVTTSDDSSTKASVWLRNTSSDELVPEFTAVLENGDGNPPAAGTVKVKAFSNAVVPANGVARYRVVLEGSGLGGDLTGELVASAPDLASGEGVAPATVSLSAAPEPLVDLDADWAIWLPLILTAVLVVVSVGLAGWGSNLGNALPAAELDFSKSFATTLTLVGALLGTAISAGVLPDEPVTWSKDTYTALNLLFAVVVVVAGVVYAALPSKVGVFVLAGAITTFGVLGELWTLWHLVDELGQDSGFTDVGVVTFKVALVVALGAIMIYVPRRVGAVGVASRPPGQGETAMALPSTTPSGNITLL